MPTIPIIKQNEDYHITPEQWREQWREHMGSDFAKGKDMTVRFVTQSEAFKTFTSKPSMLFVDDRTKRIHYAIDVLMPKYDVTIAANVPEALRLLCSRDWDYVSLDHDLDGFDMNDPDRKDTGMEIVRYIEKTGWPPNRKAPTFIIHSSNALAAHLMDVSLQELNFQTMQVRINYTTDHMEYDEDGNPQ